MKTPKKKPSKPIPAGARASDNARALAALARKLTFAKIGRRISQTEGAVRHYAAGRRVPDELAQLRIHEAYALPLAGWLPAAMPKLSKAEVSVAGFRARSDDQPTAREAVGHLPKKEAIAEAGISEQLAAEDEGLLSRYRRLAVTLEGAIGRASNDKNSTSRDVAAIAQALSRCLQHIGRLTGEGEITEAMIVKAPAFGRVLDVIREVGRRHKDAAREIFDGLSKLGGAS